MEVKEKIISKEDILKLIDDSKIEEVFEAIKTHEGKYNESMYENLKTDFIHGNIRIDYFDRLRVFVNSLREDKEKQDTETKFDNDNHLLLNTKRLKRIISRIKFFAYASILLIIMSILCFSISIDNYEIKTVNSIRFFLTGLSILVSVAFIFIRSFLLKKEETSYQILIAEVSEAQHFSFFTPQQILEAGDTLTKFLYSKYFAIWNNNILHIGLIMILIVTFIYSPKDKDKKVDTIKNSLSPQTYLYSPSFDSLLQNDKKVYQYVDSLIQKHKK